MSNRIQANGTCCKRRTRFSRKNVLLDGTQKMNRFPCFKKIPKAYIFHQIFYLLFILIHLFFINNTKSDFLFKINALSLIVHHFVKNVKFYKNSQRESDLDRMEQPTYEVYASGCPPVFIFLKSYIICIYIFALNIQTYKLSKFLQRAYRH